MKKMKVIKIINEYSLIINAGIREGIKKGDRFLILDNERFLEDPDTGEILGTFPGFKQLIVAEDVKKKYSICSTPQSEIHTFAPMLSTVSESLRKLSDTSVFADTNIYQKPREKLNVSKYDIDDIFSDFSDSLITIGDIVIREEDS